MTIDAAFWELGSYVVTVVGLPVAIGIFLLEQRKERDNEEEEGYQLLSDAYNDFLKVVLANPDLHLRSAVRTPNLSPEQQERKLIIFEMLVALFERAYLVAYAPRSAGEKGRRWNSWEDWMREWCEREDFCRQLPTLLRGEDPDFSRYILGIAREQRPDCVPVEADRPPVK